MRSTIVRLLGIGVLGLSSPLGLADEPAPDIHQLILQAGNSDDDQTRLKVLESLKPLAKGTPMEAELSLLTASIEKWTNGENLNYFGWELNDFNYEFSPDSPLYPIFCFYKVRMQAQRQLESAKIFRPGREADRQEYQGEWWRLLNMTKEAFPKNRIARMYLGEPLPSPHVYPPDARAPLWANAVRENLERLTDIIEWWIDNRQRPDGQYGGGWDDDVEMWRHWAPVLIGFDSPGIIQAQKKLSEGLLGTMPNGYDDFFCDVEHTAEPTADTITPMMLLEPENEAWSKKALRLADLMETFWTGTNEKGFRQFKNVFLSATKIGEDPVQAADTPYHSRAVQPALLYWQRTGDKRLTKLFTSWMDAWVDASESTYLGKPSGVIPPAIHWPDGNPGGKQPDFPNWWDTQTYEWPSALTMMASTMLLTYHMTGDEKYMAPIHKMARMHAEFRPEMKNGESVEPGTPQWCVSKSHSILGVVAKYRVISGDAQYDELLRHAGGYVSYQVDKNSASFHKIVRKLEENAEILKYNFEGYTSELRYTDRLLSFNMILPPDAPLHNQKPDAGLLFSVVTGDPGGVGYFPCSAVRWLTGPRNMGVFVTDSGPREFRSLLYNFQEKPRQMGAQLYMLEPGDYEYALTDKEGREVVASGSFSRTKPVSEIRFALPPGMECVLRIQKTPKAGNGDSASTIPAGFDGNLQAFSQEPYRSP